MPKLPEASGERCGQIGAGPLLRMLIIGDSAAAGVGVANQQQALSGQLSHALQSRFSLQWRLVAKSGVDSRACHRHLTAQHQRNALVYDVAVLSLGVNDVTGRCSAKQWRERLEHLSELLTTQCEIRQLIFTKVPPMGQFKALRQPMRWYLGQKSQHFNQILADFVANRPQCSLLSIDGQLSDRHMAVDGFHPGAVIYQKWGAAAGKHIIALDEEAGSVPHII